MRTFYGTRSMYKFNPKTQRLWEDVSVESPFKGRNFHENSTGMTWKNPENPNEHNWRNLKIQKDVLERKMNVLEGNLKIQKDAVIGKIWKCKRRHLLSLICILVKNYMQSMKKNAHFILILILKRVIFYLKTLWTLIYY